VAYAVRGQMVKPYGCGATGFGVRLAATLLKSWE
jgi:hypothetical protein